MKTLLLDCQTTCDYALVGLVSALRDYRLAWTLNHTLKLRFTRLPDLILDFRSRGRLAFTRFQHLTPAGALHLLRNRSAEPSAHPRPFLIPELASFDYLLRFDETLAATRPPERWLPALRQTPAVEYVRHFAADQLRDWQNLLF